MRFLVLRLRRRKSPRAVVIIPTEPKATPTPIPAFVPLESPDDGDEKDEAVYAGVWEVEAPVAIVVGIVVRIEEVVVVVVGSPEPSV